MKPRFPLHAFVLLCLFCAVAAAAPGVEVKVDRSEDAASVFPGRPIDLLVRIDPGKEGVAVAGLEVEADAGGNATFGEPVLPPPDDDGVYRESFDVRVPMEATASGKWQATASVRGETGAGEPFAKEATGKVYAESQPGRHVTGSISLKKTPAVAGEANALVLTLNVIGGYHVYGKAVEYGLPFTAEFLPGGPERLWSGGDRVTPEGKEIYGDFEIEIPFTPLREGLVEARVALFWQACTEQICDPNEMDYLPVGFKVEKGKAAAAPAKPAKGLLELVIASIFGALFAMAMPCTYPLIPITISFFTKQAEKRHGNVVPLALAYGGGIVAIFAGIGLLVGTAAFSADSVLDFATNRWVNGIFALLFIVFGLSLVGLFDIRLPGWFDNVAAKAGSSGGFASVFAMGATLVVTSFTCTAPIVGFVLVLAAKTGDWSTATICMTVFGLTMAIPFVFLSLSPTALQKLPRSGIWMKHLKVTLGILEMGLALKFISNVDLAIQTYVIGRELFLVLWAASFLAAALYLLGAFGLFRAGLTAGRGIAAAAMLAATGYLLNGLNGPLKPAEMEGFLPNPPRAEGAKKTGALADYSDGFAASVVDDYPRAVEVAKAKGKLLFIHFTGFQ